MSKHSELAGELEDMLNGWLMDMYIKKESVPDLDERLVSIDEKLSVVRSRAVEILEQSTDSYNLDGYQARKQLRLINKKVGYLLAFLKVEGVEFNVEGL